MSIFIDQDVSVDVLEVFAEAQELAAGNHALSDIFGECAYEVFASARELADPFHERLYV